MSSQCCKHQCWPLRRNVTFSPPVFTRKWKILTEQLVQTSSNQTGQLGSSWYFKAKKTNRLKPPIQSFAEPPAGWTHYLQTLSKSEAFPYSTKSIKQKLMTRPKYTCWRSFNHVSSHPVTPLGPRNSNCLLQTLRRIWINTAQHYQFLMAQSDIFILLL